MNKIKQESIKKTIKKNEDKILKKANYSRKEVIVKLYDYFYTNLYPELNLSCLPDKPQKINKYTIKKINKMEKSANIVKYLITVVPIVVSVLLVMLADFEKIINWIVAIINISIIMAGYGYNQFKNKEHNRFIAFHRLIVITYKMDKISAAVRTQLVNECEKVILGRLELYEPINLANI